MSESKVIVIIPARGGSERIKNKNIIEFAGKPLITNTIESSKLSNLVDEVYVSTNDEEIAKIARASGAKVIDRPEEISSSIATSESAIIHAISEIELIGEKIDLVVFLQCTTPNRDKNDIDNAIILFRNSDADSLFSGCKDYGLFWKEHDDKFTPINYDFNNRKREQDMKTLYRENGSIYIFRPEFIKKTGTRLGGKIIMYEMNELNSLQIDRPNDFILAECVIRNRIDS